MTHHRISNDADIAAEFGEALRAAGFRLQGAPVMDGAWHRAAVEGDKGRRQSGRYRGYLDGRPAGFAENFKDPSRTGAWKASAEAPRLSAAERAAARLKIATEKAIAESGAERRLDAIAERCSAEWERAAPAPADHAYILRKGSSAEGLRVNVAGQLLVPMRDFAGRIRSLQTIAADGAKLFPLGSRVHGLHLLLGEVRPGGVLLVAEGYATGRTLFDAEVPGAAVAVAFAKPNFVAIAEHYGKQVPGLRIGICGDNDHHLPRRDPPLRNVGKEDAEKAARATGSTAVVPAFEPHEAGTDWNDYAAAHGLDAVRAAIEAALPPQPPPPLEPHYPAPENTRAEALNALDLEVGYFFERAAAHVSAAEAWRKGTAALDLVHPPKSPGRRRALRAARAEMAAVHGPDWQKPGHRLLLPAAAGGGKTRLTAAEIAKRLPELGRVAFYTDTLDNAGAVASKIPTAKVVRGRSAIDPKSATGARMCLRHQAAEAVAFAGLPVGRTICRDADGRTCPLFAGCAYQRAAAERREGTTVSVGSHEYVTLRGGMPAPDVVVIDENCVSKLIGHVEFGADRLLPVEMPEWHAGGLAAATAYRDFMRRVAEAVQDPAGILAGLRSRGIGDAAAFTPAVAFLRAVEEREYTSGITPTMDDAAVLERLERHARSEIHAVLKMLLALRAEIALPRDQAHGVAFHPDKPVTVDGRQERQNRISVHYRKDLAFRADVPVLVLDASGDAEIYRQLLGDRLTAAAAVQCERNVEVVQVRDATLPRSSLLGTDRRGDALSDTSPARAERLRAEMVATANALAAKHGDLFMLATNMAVEAAVTADAAEVGVNAVVVTGHFGKLRGRNDYEYCAAGMVLGRNQPPASAMEGMARAIWADDPEPLTLSRTYEKATRGIRMRDGSAMPVEVDVHPDPRVQRVLELHRERESEQAADRLRLIHNAERKVLYVACNLPLNLTVDRVVTRRALVHEATGRVDNGQEGKGRRIYGNRLAEAYRLSGGILPLSHRELSRVFSGLWPSERRAREDLGKSAVSAIRTLLAETALFRPALVTYRLEGQRCPSRALVSPDIPDGRAALQALLGKPVVAYEAEDGPEPPEPPSAPRPPPPAEHASEPAVPNTMEVSMPHSSGEPGAMRSPTALMLAQHGVALADSADASRCYPDLWKTPAAARQAFYRARRVTAPCGEAPEGHRHAPLRQVSYQSAGVGKRATSLTFDPAAMPPDDLRAWLEARIGPLVRFELDPEHPPPDVPEAQVDTPPQAQEPQGNEPPKPENASPPPEPQGNDHHAEPDGSGSGSEANPAWPEEPTRRPPEAVNGSEGMGASDAPELPPGPPEPVAAPSAAVVPAELQAVQLLRQRLRLADLAMRLREARPKRTYAVRAVEWNEMEIAARSAAQLPTTAWRTWREEAGPEGVVPPQAAGSAVVESAYR